MPSLKEGVYTYSFSLFPLLLQPSGSLNFSQVGDSSINFSPSQQIITAITNNPNILTVINSWGCTYNIFRCMSGMGGLAFYS
jgi:hypothetical protein